MTTSGPATRPAGVSDVIAGRYRIERELGRGGMAYVVAAKDSTLGRSVAIKLLHPHVLLNEEAVARFEREARAAAMVNSIHACRIFDVGRSEEHGLYLIMELLEGHDLGTLLSAGPLPVGDAVTYTIQACDALAAAHGHGIVHRDLKPANLFIARQADGHAVVKLLDFGVSKLTEATLASAEASLTPTIRIVGSLEYMSPEAVRSAKHVDHRTDVWSLGAILYELLTGRAPFQGRNPPAVIISIASHEPAPLLGARPDAPPGLEPVIRHCLRRELTERTSSVGRLALELLPFAPGQEALVAGVVTRCVAWDPSLRDVRVPQPGAQAARGDADSTFRGDFVPPPATLPPVQTPTLPLARRVRAKLGALGWPWIVLGLLTVTVLGAALGWAACARPEPPPSAPTPR